MTDVVKAQFEALDIEVLAKATGRVVVFAEMGGGMDKSAKRVNKLTRGALARLIEGEAFEKAKAGEALELGYPTGMAAEAVQVIKYDRRHDAEAARKIGARIGEKALGKEVLVMAGNLRHVEEVALGAMLRAYSFVDHRTGEAGEVKIGALTVMVARPDVVKAKAAAISAIAEGVFFTRDLVNEPSNVLNTTEFADRLKALSKLGLKVEVLEEAELEKLGMKALLGVGQGSRAPSKVVVIQHLGGEKDAAPLALVGKGVVFDTGGISLKPAAGMEDMVMDMGGAGTVAGVMKTLALRGARANVVALVGIVENMPDGNAQRPGDVVTSMKGDTIEVINTDAEGRLVLCDVMWYAQERFKPAAMIDMATLTGAILIALGHENTGVFSNDDAFCRDFLKAAEAEREGAWRMPLSPVYDKELKSRVADMKNVGARTAGSITAAQFLQRFVKDGTPWIHLDIAGTAFGAKASDYAPAGATGWGVRALNRLVADNYETE
ncbi:MAG: leucyl aminopeptidase [Rhodobacterales bacterium]|nr:MAG: leucyl aminopeptidase [Rhodobacterales bacterium]PIE12386.1 MAG: leucyl aminopeptidase [Rhodobacterales bacterium]